MNKLVSIIVPNYNGEMFLADTIESVIHQNYDGWELIIVDDGSTDKSEKVVKKYLSTKIHFIKRPSSVKKGGNACRNLGIKSAKGKYLIFLDSDDLLAPYCLEQRMKYMEQHPELDFAVFNMYHFSNDISKHKLHSHLGVDDPLKHFLGLNCLWQTTSPIWKSEFMRNLMFDEEFPRFQDPEMTIRAFLFPNVKYEVVVSSIPDAYYRVNCKKNNKKVIDYTPACDLFIERFYALLSDGDKFEKSRLSLFYFITQSYMCSGLKENYPIYLSAVEKLSIKKTISNKVVKSFCSEPIRRIIMSNIIFKKLCIHYIDRKMGNVWGDDRVTYK